MHGARNSASQDLETLFREGALGTLSDDQLLGRFVERRETAALEVLVHRHGPMVWGVCRRVLRDRHDAEDAFQAAFLVLVRRAASVAPREKLGNWLYGVAYRTARKARSTRAKRRARERREEHIAEPTELSEGSREAWTEVFDEELNRLPEKYRGPIVLCELEGKSHKEAAVQLGWPVGTVSSRLSRGRDRLRGRLARRGLAPAVDASSSPLMPSRARPAASESIDPESACLAMLRVVMGDTSNSAWIPTGVETLASEIMKGMTMIKTRALAAVVLAASVVASGAMLLGRTRAEQPPLQDVPRPKAKADDVGPIPFQTVGIDAEDLAQVAGLDIYKFRFNLAKGRKFRIVLRGRRDEKTPARELVGVPFQVTEDIPTTVRVSFLRTDRKLQGFLLGAEPQAEYRVSLSGGCTHGFVCRVENPLGDVEIGRRGLMVHQSGADDEKAGPNETRLISILTRGEQKGRGFDVSGYPRAEVLLLRD